MMVNTMGRHFDEIPEIFATHDPFFFDTIYDRVQARYYRKNPLLLRNPINPSEATVGGPRT